MDEIIDISKAREKFFGCSGKMLLPSSATVACIVTQVPKGKVITTTYLCQALAQQFEVQACCPVTTKKALQAMAHESGDKVAYWRVLNGKGELVNYFPGGRVGQAALLRQEGLGIDQKGKLPKVKDLAESLVQFG